MAKDSLDALDWLRKQLEQDTPDLVREMLGAFVQTLMGAEADAICGAGYGERSPERVNSRNGSRHRDFATRAGTSSEGTLSDEANPAINARSLARCWYDSRPTYASTRRTGLLIFFPSRPVRSQRMNQ